MSRRRELEELGSKDQGEKAESEIVREAFETYRERGDIPPAVARAMALAKGEPALRCAECGHETSAGDRFCEECGHGLSTETRCPECSQPVLVGGDFCEACGHWMVGGACRFCYSDLLQGAAFCPECGNPSSGARCHGCGTVGYFDYCSSCYLPLTEAALELEAKVAAEPEFDTFARARDRVVGLMREMATLEREMASDLADEPAARGEPRADADYGAMLGRLDALEQRLKPVDAASSTTEPRTAAPRPVEQREAKRDLPARKEKLSRLTEQLEEEKLALRPPVALSTTFANNQLARRHFMACRPPSTRGWRCNAYDAIHDVPMQCAKPKDGGEWLT